MPKEFQNIMRYCVESKSKIEKLLPICIEHINSLLYSGPKKTPNSTAIPVSKSESATLPKNKYVLRDC